MSETKKLDKGSTICAGKVYTATVKLKVAAYYPGMPLSYNATNREYEYQSNLSTATAFYYGSNRDGTETSIDHGQVIVGGEIYESGIVNNSNAAVTLTEQNRIHMRARGFYPL